MLVPAPWRSGILDYCILIAEDSSGAQQTHRENCEGVFGGRYRCDGNTNDGNEYESEYLGCWYETRVHHAQRVTTQYKQNLPHCQQ